MPFPSAETRWFFAGEAPRDLLEWFAQSYTEASFGRRTDYYLAGLDETINVKWREGNIEVKQRQAQQPNVGFDGSQRGHLESWVKWSFPLQDDHPVLPEIHQHPDAWIGVDKGRHLRTFILEGEEVTETAPGSYPAKGCQAELTQVSCRDHAFYTIGLEAFGQSPDLPGLLRSVAAFFFDGDFPLRLRGEESMGYAAWLAAYAPAPDQPSKS